jgi:hypothetical protein
MKVTTHTQTCLRAAVLLALLALLSPAAIAPIAAQNVAAVRPEPAALELDAGETATVEIRLENAGDVYGIDVRGAFDPAILEIVDAGPSTEGVQMRPGAFPQPDFVALNAADNAAGALRYVVTQVNPTPPATGSGVVFSFEVRGRAGGATDLAITLVEMADRNGNLLAVTTGSTAVTVSGPPPAATGIVLQPTDAPPSGDGEAATSAATTSAPTSEAVTAPQTTATAAQAAGATPIAAATSPSVNTPPASGGDAPPATGVDQPATGDPASGPRATTLPGEAAYPAAGTAAVGEVTTNDEGAAGGAAPDEAIAESATGATAIPPAVIGGAADPADQPGAAPTTDDGARNNATVFLIIGGVAVLGLIGFLLVRMSKRG